MTGRKRVMTAIERGIPDRVPIHDDLCEDTLRRWRKEGMPEDMCAHEYFDYDMRLFSADFTPRLSVKVTERNAEYLTETTPYGGLVKKPLQHPGKIESIGKPIQKKEDWKELKNKLAPDYKRIDWASGLKTNRSAHESGKFNCLSADCGYGALSHYFDSGQLSTAASEDPEWIRDMSTTIAELIIVTAELMIKNGFKFDGALLCNSHKHRENITCPPDVYKKTLAEADRLLCQYFRSKNLKIIMQSSCVTRESLPMLIEAGIDCLQPVGTDSQGLAGIKESFGNSLALMGGIDITLIGGEETPNVEDEVKQRIEALKNGGGYIYHSDKCIPVNVSLAQYSKIIELVKKYGAYPEYREEEEKHAVQKTGNQQVGRETGKPADAEQKKEPRKKMRLPFGRKNRK